MTRYGSAMVPMDEAQASAAIDLVRRPHAEIQLSFRGDRVGELAPSLLTHALERFAIEAGCTVHVESSGADDHHVAEAAFKALGRALRKRWPRRRGNPLDEGGGVTAVRVVLADYGAGNLRSVTSAFARAGADPMVTTDPETVGASLAVIAGVGHVESAARGLAANGLDDAVRAHTAPAGRRSASASACSSVRGQRRRRSGLGLLAGPVRRLRARRIPHMGGTRSPSRARRPA